MSPPEPAPGQRWGRYLGVLAVLAFVLIAIHTVVNKATLVRGIEPGHRLPPFAVPLAVGDEKGDADIATHADDGAAGRVPACSLRGAELLNVCELYEQGPVVLVLFVDSGSCPDILSDLQALAPSFPGVRFAAVAIKGNRGRLRRLVRSQHLTLPVGIDSDGAVATLYQVASCPQVTFAYPGGVVQSAALLSRPSRATLRARLSELVAAARARGWRGAAA
jgi:AhpC/TSA family